jgi:hypothetical protein
MIRKYRIRGDYVWTYKKNGRQIPASSLKNAILGIASPSWLYIIEAAGGISELEEVRGWRKFLP